jgi:hypothetical protein
MTGHIGLTTVEVRRRRVSAVNPWLATMAVPVNMCQQWQNPGGNEAGNVLEPAIATSNRNIENQEELLVEGCVPVSADVPRIGQHGTILVLSLEMAARP